MNLYKIKYTFPETSFTIIEAESPDEATTRLMAMTQGQDRITVVEITKLTEEPITKFEGVQN